MQRLFWGSLLGMAGVGLAGIWLGQSVFGQPQGAVPLPPPPIVSGQTGSGTPNVGAIDVPRPFDGPGGRPMDPPPAPPRVPPLPVPAQSASSNSLAKPAVQAPAVSLDVRPGRQSPSLSIEWAGPPTIRVHQPMPCQILVRNTSTAALHNVIIRHPLSDGVTCKASEPQVSREGNDLIWNLGTLAPEQSRRIDFALIASGRGVLNCRATATFSAVAGYQVRVCEPQLAIKVLAPQKVVAGDIVNFICEVANPGDGVAEAVRLKTTLPEGLEHSSGRRVIEFDVGNLPPKEARKVQLPCVAKGSGVQQCRIEVMGEGNLAANDSAHFEILIPKLDITVSGPKLRYLDRHAVYVVHVTNPGSAPAAGVEVHELIPAGFRFHQADLGGRFQEATRVVSWNVGDLQPGQSKDIAVDLIPVQTGEHRLIAHAKSARGLKSEGQTQTVVEGLPSLFIEVAHVDDPIEIGAETAFEIRVANAGTKTETNIEVVCILPEQLEFKGAECKAAMKFRLENRELIFEPLAKLAPKADVVYRVKVRGLAAGDVRFKTRIRADNVPNPLLREESMRVYSDGVLPRPAPTSAAPPMIPAPPLPSVVPAPAILQPSASGDPIVAPVPIPLPDGIPAPRPAPLP